MARVIEGRYALQDEPIASGGMADVYKAVDVGSPDMPTVAVKLLRLNEDREGLIALFFEREVRALNELRHPNIVTLLDAGYDESDGRRYLVLEWMPEDLPARLAAIRPEGWDDFADAIALPLLEGLAHAHDRQVVHRDVKPANVLVAADGTPKLANFGISKMKSTLGRSAGTVAEFVSRPYAPPEDASMSGFTRDVFGFGVLVLACLSSVVSDSQGWVGVAVSIGERSAPSWSRGKDSPQAHRRAPPTDGQASRSGTSTSRTGDAQEDGEQESARRQGPSPNGPLRHHRLPLSVRDHCMRGSGRQSMEASHRRQAGELRVPSIAKLEGEPRSRPA
jgi:serine/threonine protein kinase